MRVISSNFPRCTIASLRQVEVSSLTPLHGTIKVNSLETGVDTQKAGSAHFLFWLRGRGRGEGGEQSALTKRTGKST